MNRQQFARETPLVFSDVPKRLPKRNGKKVHYSTVYRWATKGVAVASWRRYVLAAFATRQWKRWSVFSLLQRLPVQRSQNQHHSMLS